MRIGAGLGYTDDATSRLLTQCSAMALWIPSILVAGLVAALAWRSVLEAERIGVADDEIGHHDDLGPENPGAKDPGDVDDQDNERWAER